jgi:uncharacterized protein YkwD
MLHYRFFSHDDVFGQNAFDRINRFGNARAFHYVGENIATDYGSTGAVCRAWMASAVHRADILSRRYRLVGAGYAGTFRGTNYYVEDFAGPFGHG